MADTKLTALTAASALAGADLFYVSQSAASRKATGTQLLALVGTAYVPLAGGTMTGALTLPAGAVGTPSLMFTGSAATTGIYSPAPNTVAISILGTRRLYMDDVGGVVFTNTSFTSGGLFTTAGNMRIADASTLGWSSTVDPTATQDVILRRDAAATLAQRNGTNAQTLRIYGTADGSPGSNYQRLVLSANGTTGVTIAAEGLGTPGANQNITLTTGGTGTVNFGSNASVTAAGVYLGSGIIIDGTDSSIGYYGVGLRQRATAEVAWTSSVASSAVDTALMRNAAGVLEVNSGTAGTWRDVKLRNLIQTEYSQLTEMTAPSAPAANSVRIYAEDNGAGKTRLMALFATGSAVQLGIEP